MTPATCARQLPKVAAAIALTASLAACQSVGPSREAVAKAGEKTSIPGLQLVDVTAREAIRGSRLGSKVGTKVGGKIGVKIGVKVGLKGAA